MHVKLSPAVYLALCALVKDSLEVQSDATPLLRMAALELAAAAESGDLPEAVTGKADVLAALRDEAEEKDQSAA